MTLVADVKEQSDAVVRRFRKKSPLYNKIKLVPFSERLKSASGITTIISSCAAFDNYVKAIMTYNSNLN